MDLRTRKLFPSAFCPTVISSELHSHSCFIKWKEMGGFCVCSYSVCDLCVHTNVCNRLMLVAKRELVFSVDSQGPELRTQGIKNLHLKSTGAYLA